MNSNIITNPSQGSVKLSKLSHLTNEQLLRQMEIDRIEERISPYIIDMSKQLPDEQPLISIDGNCICSRGNISAICGEAKSKKTFLASALVASAMAIPYNKLNNFKNVDKDMDINVLWVDTEQGERHVRRVIERISTMTGAKMGGSVSEPRLMTLSLRELSPTERYSIMLDTIARYPFDLIVIDGIADLQRNTNDLEESDALVGALMSLSTKTNTHILCVLHTNPGSDKARGHLGSSLQRKAETVIYVHRNGECSVVEPQFCRNEPFERFAFNISEEGIPEICDIPQSESLSINERIVDILDTEYGGVVERATLSKKVVEVLGVNIAVAKMRIKRLLDKGTLIFDGNLVRSTSNKVTSQQSVPCVTPVTSVTPVTTVAPAAPAAAAYGNATRISNGELNLAIEPAKPQYIGHYDYDEYEDCPF
ncbi:MAG: AAA family ATPase [Alistipes sp.]|nr:AAA family ATPase [Alistipes sp.]